MYPQPIPLWKQAPFLRILAPFIAAILLEFYVDVPDHLFWILLLCSVTGLICLRFLSLKFHFSYLWLAGSFINALILSVGGIITSSNNPFSKANLLDQFGVSDCIFFVSLLEPPAEKPASWKATAKVLAVQSKQRSIHPSTKMILYFRKDTALKKPSYGDCIIFKKQPGKIENPELYSSFDYKRYCASKNIHHQVFLKPQEYIILTQKKINPLDAFLFGVTKQVTDILKKYIPGKKECGLAQALLIGYKNDLDRSLVQAYSNTGVVHVIAISGLHLGLIYLLLKILCKPFSSKKQGRFFTLIIIVTGLWLFSLLCGGSPSVLRSAVMFTSIVAGEFITRRTSVLNNLAASAFFLLCYEPFWLWDLGFLLSYTALLSIIILNKPIYALLNFENKIANAIWKMNAVTLSAQALTMPILIYNFNQFPNLFLLTNFIAIPLSSCILIGEIILCAIYYFQPVAYFLGKLLSFLISMMNSLVVHLDSYTFSSTRGLEINLLQVLILYVGISFTTLFLIAKKKHALHAALFSAILFFIEESFKIWK